MTAWRQKQERPDGEGACAGRRVPQQGRPAAGGASRGGEFLAGEPAAGQIELTKA